MTQLPDPDGCNQGRAARGTVALAAYAKATGTDDEDVLADLLCDLMHWADNHDIEFEDELARAFRNHTEETTE